MKTFSGLFEDAEPEIVRNLRNRIESVMGPGYQVGVGIRKFLGQPSIVVLFADDHPKSNIAYNSPVCTHVMLDLKPSPNGKYSWTSTGHTRREVLFRQISSKVSPEDAADKLVKWFQTSKDRMDSLMKYGKYATSTVGEDSMKQFSDLIREDNEDAQIMSKADLQSLINAFDVIAQASHSDLNVAVAVCNAASRKAPSPKEETSWRQMGEGFGRIKETIDHFTKYHKESFQNMKRNIQFFKR